MARALNEESNDVETGRRSIANEVGALALLALTAFFFISLYSEHDVAASASALQNACGAIGHYLGGTVMAFLGLIASYVLVGVFTIWALCHFFNVRIVGWGWRLFGASLVMLATASLEFVLMDVPFFDASYDPAIGTAYFKGGYFGDYFGRLFVDQFGRTGLYIVCALFLAIGVVFVADVRVSPLVRLMFWRGREAAVEVGRRVPGMIEQLKERLPKRQPAPEPEVEKPTRKKAASKAKKTSTDDEKEEKDAKKASATKKASGKSASGTKTSKRTTTRSSTKPVTAPPVEEAAEEVEEEELEAEVVEVEESDDADDADDADDEGEWEYEEEGEEDEGEWEYEEGEEGEEGEWEEGDEADEEGDSEAEDEEEEEAEAEAEEAPKVERKILLSSRPAEPEIDPNKFEETQLSLAGMYTFPPIEFLADPAVVNHDEGRDELEVVALTIERTLASFKIECQVVEVQRGPSITQFELSLAAGIKVQRIVALSDDLAMALSARSIRVVAPIPGKNTVGVEVPNRKREVVCLKELLLSKSYAESDQQIPLMLGKDVSGEPIVVDLAAMPHLLIAGSTGSGKSVCINAIIASMLMTRPPDDLKLILVDPKMVELSLFEDIPHLLTPVITDMKKAPAALDWVVRKMEQRYALMANAEVRNIKSYNALDKKTIFERLAPKIGHEDAENAPEHLPYIVVIIDELADLMMTASKEIETSIIRLAQKSRAVGIHVILATQRPSVDVITGLIKSNLPCRISFMVASKIDSRTILDRNGADKLLGQGDMLYMGPGSSMLIRAQSTFISDKEIRKMTRFLKKETNQEFSKEIEGFLDAGGNAPSGDSGQDDDMFDQAVRIVLESQRGSVSLLQRRLGVGYTRASRLMDIMGERGIVGPFKGSKAREVFFTIEDWEANQSE